MVVCQMHHNMVHLHWRERRSGGDNPSVFGDHLPRIRKGTRWNRRSCIRNKPRDQWCSGCRANNGRSFACKLWTLPNLRRGFNCIVKLSIDNRRRRSSAVPVMFTNSACCHRCQRGSVLVVVVVQSLIPTSFGLQSSDGI